MKTIKHFSKQDKLDLISAIKSGEIAPAEINEDSLFCIGDVWYDNMILVQESEKTGEPPKKMFYIGKGITNLNHFLKKVRETDVSKGR